MFEWYWLNFLISLLVSDFKIFYEQTSPGMEVSMIKCKPRVEEPQKCLYNGLEPTYYFSAFKLGQSVNVKRILIHSKYDNIAMVNDIAILKLKKKLIFNDNVKPACLPDQSISIGGMGLASGWGDVDSK